MRVAQRARLKKAFLEKFSEYGNITSACQAINLERRRVYDWQEHDDQFAAAFREAEITATEHLEHEARRRAVEGVEKQRRVFDNRGNLIDEYTEYQYSDTLLIFLLKARAPEKYRERIGVEHSGTISVGSDLDEQITAAMADMATGSQGALTVAETGQT